MNPLNSRSASGARSGFAPPIARLCWAFALVSMSVVSRGAAQTPSPGRVPAAGTNAQAAPAFSGDGMLEKVWPGHPDSLAMLVDIIVKGDRLQGTDGWFRKDRPQTRFGWEAARSAWELHTRAVAGRSASNRRSSSNP